jgi:hypothetical protein
MMGFKSNSTGRGGGHSEMVIHDTGGKELVNIHSQKDMVTTVLNDKTSTITANHSTTVLKGHQSNTVALGDQANTVQTGSQTTTVKQAIQITSTDNTITLTAAEKITFKCGASEITMDKAGNIKVNGMTIESIASANHTVIGGPLHLNPPGGKPPPVTSAIAGMAAMGGAMGQLAASNAGAGTLGASRFRAVPSLKFTPPAAMKERTTADQFDEKFQVLCAASQTKLQDVPYRVWLASTGLETMGTTASTGQTNTTGTGDAAQDLRVFYNGDEGHNHAW